MVEGLDVYRVDTNVRLERLLDRERGDEVGRFLDLTPPAQFYLTEFALYEHRGGAHSSRKERPAGEARA